MHESIRTNGSSRTPSWLSRTPARAGLWSSFMPTRKQRPAAVSAAVVIGLTFSLGCHAGETERVSVSSTGAQANSASALPAISADGRFVAFYSFASNLVPGEELEPQEWRVYVRDRRTGTTTRINANTHGGFYGRMSLSGDGRFVAYAARILDDQIPLYNYNVYVHDQHTGMIEQITHMNADAYAASPSLSADGRFVAYQVGDASGSQVFVHDAQTGDTELMSASNSGEQGNGFSGGAKISADGRFVAFVSPASNLVPGDTNGFSDVFVRDRQTGTIERVSNSDGQSDGESFAAEITADGRFVAFSSRATNLVRGEDGELEPQWRVYVRDRQTGSTQVIAAAGSDVAISADGRYVAFSEGVFPGDLVLHDRETGRTEPISVRSSSGEHSQDPAISANGGSVAFTSYSSNLVPGDTNGFSDVFVHNNCTSIEAVLEGSVEYLLRERK